MNSCNNICGGCSQGSCCCTSSLSCTSNNEQWAYDRNVQDFLRVLPRFDEMYIEAKLERFYSKTKRINNFTMHICLVVMYYLVVYGAIPQYRWLMGFLCFATLLINSKFHMSFFDLVNPSGRAGPNQEPLVFSKYKWKRKLTRSVFNYWTRFITGWNIAVHFLRLLLAKDADYALVISCLGIFAICTMPTRPMDPHWCMVPFYILSFGTSIHMYWQYGLCLHSFAMFTVFFVVGHQLNDISYSMMSKCAMLNEMTKAKSEFVSNVSHEFRNPLLGVSASIELLQATLLNEEQREHLDTISSCSNILQALIEDILQFSKLESVDDSVVEQFSVRDCLGSVEKIIKSYATHLNCCISIRTEDDVPCVIKGDNIRLQQLILNLLSNAVKASSDKGHVSMITSVSKSTQKQVELKFEIKDDGPGIPVEKQHLLFQPFSQLKTIPERTVPSTGLGLVICKKIVERMRGRIGFSTSTEAHNHGTTFTVFLAFDKVEGSDTINLCQSNANLNHTISFKNTYLEKYNRYQNAEIMKRTPQSLTKIEDQQTETVPQNANENSSNEEINVAIADDNLINKAVILRLLKQKGYNVVKALDNGQELVDFVCSDPPPPQLPSVIVSDYHMPLLNGDKAASIIRKRYPDIRIILLTGNAFMNEDLPELKGKVDKILYKPVKSQDLSSAINNLIAS